MPDKRVVTVYIDFKSPYAYLAKDPAYELAREFGVTLDWLPYVLDIPAYLGSARLGENGEVVEENRNAHQWRRVRYSYMDCRRQARKRGLTIRGTQKIWDSTLAAAGMLFAKRQGDDVLRRYIDMTFVRFWRRELDIEDAAVIAGLLAEAGANTVGFAAFAAADGPREVARVSRAAEDAGVFGVPSFVIDGELFWGSEHCLIFARCWPGEGAGVLRRAMLDRPCRMHARRRGRDPLPGARRRRSNRPGNSQAPRTAGVRALWKAANSA